MKLTIPVLGLSAQVPFTTSGTEAPKPSVANPPKPGFAFKEGPDTFSPKDLVSLGRPGAAVANAVGDLAFVPYSKYSFDDKKNHKFLYVISVNEPDVEPLQIQSNSDFTIGDVFWLADRTLANVKGVEDGAELYTLDLDFGEATKTIQTSGKPELVGRFPTAGPTNFRYRPESSYLVFSDYVYDDSNLTTVKEQDEAWENRGNTAYVYDSTYTRHWDEWVGPKRPQLFSVSLKKEEDGKWKLGNEFNAPLRGTKHYSPVEPFGGTDDFDASNTHIVYTTKDPELPEAWHTKQNVYIVDIAGGSEPKELTSGKQGAIHGPVFNTAGNKVAWLELDEDGYESDRSKIVIYDLEKDIRFTVTQNWDRSPGSLAFSLDDSFIYLTAGDIARVKVFALPVAPTPDKSTRHPHLDVKYSKPVAITHSRAASDVQVLPNGRLLFSQSSLTSPNDAFLIKDLESIQQAILDEKPELLADIKPTQLSKLTQKDLEGKYFSEGEHIWFKGAHHRDIHGWILKPKGWAPNDGKKWPALLLIHGGPQGAWEDQWSTRWNPNVFANQGYFVVMINPTGSTTYGQELTDGIAGDWGGKVFKDLVNGWKYALEKYPEIDQERLGAAGASYGGYAINWIQGHPELGFGFKALVCHDGGFDTQNNAYATDELFFFLHEWGGKPWEDMGRKLIEKMSPLNYVHKWSTPQLVIHGSKDYRLPETDGIGAFHALQMRGVPSRLVIFPDENHWVLKHGNSLKWHYEVLKWFDQFIGTPTEE